MEDIYRTKVCPLAKVMRRECKKRGIAKLKVVYSEEKPKHPSFRFEEGKQTALDEQEVGTPFKLENEDESSFCQKKGTLSGRKKSIPGSVAFVPPVCGFIIAGEVIKDLISRVNT